MFIPRSGLAVSVVVGLMVAMVPLQASASAHFVPGVLVDDTVHAAPGPNVALAPDGRALVAYQDAIPGDTSNVCTRGGGACSILGTIVDADGVTVGAPFVLSGDVVIDSYYSGPSITWNNDLNEWLVVFTSYRPTFDSVYAQRVSASGLLLGDQVELPTRATTTAGDRTPVGGPVNLQPGSHVKASATWSSADQAYLITWFSTHSSSPIATGNTSVFGYLATGDLQPADGVQASFVVSDAAAHQANVEVGYAESTDEWMVLWTGEANTRRDVARAQSISFAAGATTVSPSIAIVEASAAGYAQWQMAGGVTWVDSVNAWLFSWGARPADAASWATFGRFLTEGVLGPIAQLSAFEGLPDNRTVGQLMSQELHYDAATDTVHAVATGAEMSYNRHLALYWTVNPRTLTPGPLTEFRQSNETQTTAAASRIRMSGLNGGIAIVYQNWPTGSYGDPAQVRYALLNPISLDPTPTITLSASELAPGSELAISGSGFTPNSSVVVELRTDPSTIVTVQSDENGEIDAVIVVPKGTPKGEYEVRATDIASGAFATAAITITPMLAATGGADLTALGAGTAVLLLLGLTVLAAGRRAGANS